MRGVVWLNLRSSLPLGAGTGLGPPLERSGPKAITVLDRPGLEARSCECYQVVKKEFDRLLPYVVK